MSQKSSKSEYTLIIELVEDQEEAMEGYIRAVKAVLNNDETDEIPN